MFIEPMQMIDSISDFNKINGAADKQKQINGSNGAEGIAEGAQVPFKSIFEEAIKDVIDTDNQVNIDAEMLATGQSDNLHQYSIDIAKAQLSIDLLVEMRNKALDSYSEIMRMSV